MELAFNPQVKTEGANPRQQLKDLSGKFEALLLSQTFSAMRDTVPKGGLVDTGFAGDTYKGMFDQQVASLGTKEGGMGLGKALYAYLEQGLPGGEAGEGGQGSLDTRT
jgi:Rod binding domain-containing protein